jgi:hypothetical protein
MLLRLTAFAVAICLLNQVNAAETIAKSTAKSFVAPKTEFGDPDLRGVWNFSSDTPLQRPKMDGDKEFKTPEEAAAARAGRVKQLEFLDTANLGKGGAGAYNTFWLDPVSQGLNLRTSLIIDPPDGRMPPMMPGMVAQFDSSGDEDILGERPVRFRVGGISKDGPEDRGLSERCLMGFNSGPPFLPSLYNNNVQIFQTKEYVVIETEMIHDARIVPLDGGSRSDPAITWWSGESRGHWEGDTLVVDTRGFTDKIKSFNGAGSGKTLHLIERFTRVARDRVDYQFTVDDPVTFTKPITVLVPMVTAEGELYEYACHEGNYGLPNVLAGARKQERDEAAKK